MEHRAPVRLALSLVLSLSVTACGGGGGSPSVTPTPTPTASPSNEAAFQCPTSDAVASVARGGSGELRRAPLVRKRGVQTVAGLIAVSYARQTLNASRTALTAREQTLGATLVRELDFPHVGLTTRVLSVPPSQVGTVEASLRTQAGVRGVGAVARRYPTTAAPYYPNDPYFQGFNAAQTGSSSTATFETLPYVENQSVPGQWGMHAVKLETAFGYSLSVNTVPANPNALGSSRVKIAMIDTGQDTTHPELASKITYQKCFITDPNNSQSTSNFTTDQDGHGTDTAGIAAAALGNGVGFSGAGGNSVLYGYRVYPTPDDNCLNSSTTDDQCTATTMDIASAIDDAIAQPVNVISMSLGGGSCSSPGVDEDPTEGAAVAEAIAKNIIVVAAAGNQTGPPLDAPACDSGVIAAGATALADGASNPNGAGNSLGMPTNPVEYVASYSAYGTPSSIQLHSSSAWGIVAPGGDPANAGSDNDQLHWIENINTTTPFDSNFGTVPCTPDYPGTGAADCRVLIAGTSMSTPVVAGAAALVLATGLATGGSVYQSPTAMKALLCTTADDIGDSHEGCGRLNVYRAMAYALNDPVKP